MDKGYDSDAGGFYVEASYSPIQDDSTAPDQYSDGIGGARYESSEKQLMLAILTDAVRCMSQTRWSRASLDALTWIVDPAQDHVCSFDNICEALGLEPDYVRRGILADVALTHSFPITVIHEDREERRCQYESLREGAVDSKSGINRKRSGNGFTLWPMSRSDGAVMIESCDVR